MTDSITDLLGFEDFVSQAGAIIACEDKQYLIGALDIADFHYINTKCGYDTGDEVLRCIASALAMFLPNMVLCSRSHSDHFILLACVENIDSERVIHEISRLKDVVKDIISEKTGGISSNINIGVYYPEKGESNIVAAVDKANIARRTCKSNYNLPCVVYSEHLMDIKENSAKILPIFNDSFRNEAIKVYLQPKISSETKKIVGAEALSRLVDHDGNIIPPVKFIAALEKTGRIVELDFYVLTFVCRLIRKWLSSGVEPVVISFNLSRIHFYSSTLVEDICALVEKYNVPPQYLEIEVTESVFFEESDIIVSKVNKFREYGFKVSIDDFGTGYSSLSFIGALPVDVVKLDKSFVKESLRSERGNELMKGLIKILSEIHLDIVCEGVETPEEEKVVSSYGCNSIQGFLYDKPMPTDEFEEKYIH